MAAGTGRRRIVLLVESDADARSSLQAALEAEGHRVIPCPGPTAPNYTCVGGREGSCALVERADVVVLDPWLAGDEQGVGTTADALIDVYAGRGRTVVVVGSTAHVEPLRLGRIVRLGDGPSTGEVVAAVGAAPDADGFVYRDPSLAREPR